MTNDPRNDTNDPHDGPAPTPLTVRGAARRDEMLDELMLAMGVVQRSRRRRRAVGGAAVLLLAATAAVYMARAGGHGMPTVPPGPRVVDVGGTQPLPTAETPEVRLVTTDASILDRYTMPSVTRRVVMIDDDALLDELSAIGRPTGMIRAGGQVRLTAKVVDEDPAEANPAS